MEMLVIRQSDHQVSKTCTGPTSTGARYIVTHQIAGTCSIRQGQNHGVMQLGDVAIVDTEMPVHFDYRNNCTQLNLVLPKDTLWSRGERRSLEPGRIIPALGLGHFLGSFLQSCFRTSQSATDLSNGESEAIERAFVELLSVTASGTVSAGPNAVRSHLVLLQQWIESHLGDPELSPQYIAQCYGISARHLHRLFEPSGETVTQWIEHRRLETCYKEISDARHACATITEIALRWGFRDVSHFSRAFRKKYHMSPRDHRRAAATRSLLQFEKQPLPVSELNRTHSRSQVRA